MTQDEYLDWFGLLKDDPQPYFDKEKMAFVFDLFFCVAALAVLSIIINMVLRNVFRIKLYCILQNLANAVIAKFAPGQETGAAEEREEEMWETKGIIKDTASPNSVEIALKPLKEGDSFPASTALITMRYDATTEPTENAN